MFEYFIIDSFITSGKITLIYNVRLRKTCLSICVKRNLVGLFSSYFHWDLSLISP